MLGKFCRLSKETVLVLGILVALSLISCFNLFLTSGFVLREDWMVPLTWEQLCRALELYSFPWHSQLFGGWSNISFSNLLSVMVSMVPLTLIFGPMMATKIWIFLILFFSGVSMYWLSGTLIEKKTARFIAALLYIYNPWVLERILSGHQFILMAYVSAPIAVGGFIRCLRTHKPGDVLLAGFALGLTIGFNMHLVGSMVFILIILYLVYFLILDSIRSRRQKTTGNQVIRKPLTSFSIAFSIALLLNAFWIVPYASYIFSHGEFFPFRPSSEDIYWFSHSGSLLMQGYFIDHTTRIVESSLNSSLIPLWYFSGFVISALAFSATFIGSRKRNFALFFTLVAILGIFMGMGTNQPLGFLYVWLFENIPFFISYRNPNGFVFLVVLSYSLLLGILVSAIGERALAHPKKRKKIPFLPKIFSKAQLNVDNFLALVMCILIVSYSFPMLTGDFGGELRPVEMPEYYKEIDRFLIEHPGDYRVLLLHPWPGSLYDFVPAGYFYIQDPLVHLSPRPVITLGESGPTHDFIRFMVFCLYNNRTEYVGKIMGLLGIRYILVRHDMVYPTVWAGLNASVLTQQILPGMKGMKLVRSLGNVSIYENNYVYSHIFSSKVLSLVAGDRRVLVSLGSTNEVRLDSLPLIFVQQVRSDLKHLMNQCDLIIIQNDKAGELWFPSNQIIDLGSFVGSSSNFNTEWVSSRFVTQALGDADGLFEIPGSEVDDWVVTKANNATLKIPFVTHKDGDYDLWIKLHAGPIRVKTWYAPQGSLLATLDGTIVSDDIQPVKDYESDANTANFIWKHIGEYHLRSGSHTLSLTNRAHIPWGGLNLVSKVYIGPTIKHNLSSAVSSNVLYILEAEDVFDIARNGWRITATRGSHASFGLCLESYTESGFDLFSTTTSFRIIRNDTYVLSVRLASNIENTVQVSIDGHHFDIDLDSGEQFKRYEIGPLDLNIGYHNISLTTDGAVYFDNIFIYNSKKKCTAHEFLNNLSTEKSFANSSRTNPVLYEVDLSDNTKILVFLETTDTLWQAYGATFGPHIVAYSYANGFLVYRTEQNRRVVLEYTPYRYEMIGVLLSSITAVFSISTWMFFVKTKRKSDDDT